MKIQDMTDDQLQSEYLTLYNQIEVVECFNSQDIYRYELVGQELDKRGFDIVQSSPTFVKRSEEDDETVVEDKDRKNGLSGAEYEGEKV